MKEIFSVTEIGDQKCFFNSATVLKRFQIRSSSVLVQLYSSTSKGHLKESLTF